MLTKYAKKKNKMEDHSSHLSAKISRICQEFWPEIYFYEPNFAHCMSHKAFKISMRKWSIEILYTIFLSIFNKKNCNISQN